MSEQNIPLQHPARPWDLLNKDIGRVVKTIAKTRMYICNSCEYLNQITKSCKKCKCFMPFKTNLPNAECPIGKWSMAPQTETEETSQ